MRLIDADALIEKIKNERFSGWGNCCVEIDNAPTVDANHIADDGKKVDVVQVVRCKNCRWYDKVDWCNKLRISGVKAFEETWFCAEGEEDEAD